jgi:O-antigen ligase
MMKKNFSLDPLFIPAIGSYFIKACQFIGLSGALLASLTVVANDLLYLRMGLITPSAIFLIMAFCLAFLPRFYGLMAVLFLVPLVAGIHRPLEIIFEWEIPSLPNAGLDLIAGFFLGTITRIAVQYFSWPISRRSANQFSTLNKSMPWPMGLLILVITLSATLAIIRNLRMSAASANLKGLVFNFIHFRPISWRADFMPISDWVAYALAGTLAALVIYYIQRVAVQERNAVVFRCLAAGLFAAAIFGVFQSITGFSLPQSLLEFRKDIFGFAAIGFQPDLHAFAGHMLLGVVGLWGYLRFCKNSLEKKLIFIIIICSLIGLILSKSRASLGFGVAALGIFFLIYSWRHYRTYFWLCIGSLGLIFISIIFVITLYFLGINLVPDNTWINSLISQLRTRDLTSLSVWGGILGSRFEIWQAAFRMILAYPFLGLGQGEFYRVSANEDFSKSTFLKLNGGENTHNYFLQTLAETGFTGICVFALVLLVPWLRARNRSALIPAYIGLIGLGLGNLFAHSFLVRENLLLAASLIGLLYSLSQPIGSAHFAWATKFLKENYRKLGIVGLLVLSGILIEGYSSFFREPFLRGNDCFVAKQLTNDGWTSGIWEARLPGDAKGIELLLRPGQTNLDKTPLIGRLDFYFWKIEQNRIASISHEWRNNEPFALRLTVPQEYLIPGEIITLRLRLNGCFSPQDLGINADSRLLGIQILEHRWQ